MFLVVNFIFFWSANTYPCHHLLLTTGLFFCYGPSTKSHCQIASALYIYFNFIVSQSPSIQEPKFSCWTSKAPARLTLLGLSDFSAWPSPPGSVPPLTHVSQAFLGQSVRVPPCAFVLAVFAPCSIHTAKLGSWAVHLLSDTCPGPLFKI